MTGGNSAEGLWLYHPSAFTLSAFLWLQVLVSPKFFPADFPPRSLVVAQHMVDRRSQLECPVPVPNSTSQAARTDRS